MILKKDVDKAFKNKEIGMSNNFQHNSIIVQFYKFPNGLSNMAMNLIRCPLFSYRHQFKKQSPSSFTINTLCNKLFILLKQFGSAEYSAEPFHVVLFVDYIYLKRNSNTPSHVRICRSLLELVHNSYFT